MSTTSNLIMKAVGQAVLVATFEGFVKIRGFAEPEKYVDFHLDLARRETLRLCEEAGLARTAKLEAAVDHVLQRYVEMVVRPRPLAQARHRLRAILSVYDRPIRTSHQGPSGSATCRAEVGSGGGH